MGRWRLSARVILRMQFLQKCLQKGLLRATEQALPASNFIFEPQEYLNERSHFRQTGIKTKRYARGAYIDRNFEEDPPLDAKGRYRPMKPTGWDEAYKESGPPPWYKEWQNP